MAEKVAGIGNGGVEDGAGADALWNGVPHFTQKFFSLPLGAPHRAQYFVPPAVDAGAGAG